MAQFDDLDKPRLTSLAGYSSGIRERPVGADRIRKFVGAKNTLPADLFIYEPRVMRCERSSARCGGAARVQIFAAVPSRSRSSSLISNRLRAAARNRCRSGWEASWTRLAMPCSNHYFLSRSACGPSATLCFYSRRKKQNIGLSLLY